MTESVFVRVQRVFTAKVDCATEAMERATGPALMRHSIREIEEVSRKLRRCVADTRARGADAERRIGVVRGQIATLDEQARFAIGKQREDLAEAAVARQLDYEAQIAALERLRVQTADETAALEAQLIELETRKAQMQKEFATIQSVRAASPCGIAPGERTARKVADAEEAFERAMSAAAGIDIGLADSASAARLAEVDQMRRDATIAERLAAMRAGKPGARKRAAGAKAR